MKLFAKSQRGQHKTIHILGLIKISYKQRFSKKSHLNIINNGSNNLINDNKPFTPNTLGNITFIVNGNNNRVYLGKNLNNIVSKSGYDGYVTFTLNGNNNTIYIGDNTSFNASKFTLWRDNVTFSIGQKCRITQTTAQFTGHADGIEISIGDNFCNSSTMELYAGGDKNMNLTIGNDCMFSRDIVIYAHDGHNIFNKDTQEVINNPKNSVTIGNHVWLGHGTHILKNTIIPNNTIVGAKSVVTKTFDEEYTIIAGNPAKLVKKNTTWKL